MTNIISSSSTRITSNGGGGGATTSTTTTTTTQACAACKYQRRKCAPDCILAPYFPHDRQRQFLNAHKLFGVSNITKIIKNLEPPEKDEAMRTIMFQSDVRANDPVGGCFRIIRELQRQIDFTKAELELVLHQLAICRAQTTTHLQIQDSDDSVVLSYNDIVNVGGGSCDDLSSFGSIYVHPQPQVQEQQQDHRHHQFVNVQSQLGDAWGMQEDPTMLSNPDSLHVKQLQLQQEEEGGVQVVVQENNHDFVVNDQDVKPPADQLVEIPYERYEIKFENDQVVERRRFVPSTQLLISS
ncbi:hypothetical protein Ddye_013236 [Dipteronia dyeriana]|uniref:LOB domain-containing protein n=1 Tax=Dipteronia dyeriana TaxID=168575 RepID=A0AAE0CJG0_9ROSI|nr:hypothetical protein Ddye_013236 [Dipteronia dyeriana]